MGYEDVKSVGKWGDEGDIWSRETRVWCVEGRGRVVETDVITLYVAWGAEGGGVGVKAAVSLYSLASERELLTNTTQLKKHQGDGEYFGKLWVPGPPHA